MRYTRFLCSAWHLRGRDAHAPRSSVNSYMPSTDPTQILAFVLAYHGGHTLQPLLQLGIGQGE